MPEKIGKYVVSERIGRGGMGMIFKAHDPVLERPVALKVISSEIEVTDELRARFFREAQACARLSHPNIVTIYDMGEADGRLYIVMELLEGDELRHLIAQRKVPLLEDRLSIMTQVCSGLGYAHQRGIVHRDIKPANIFLQRDGQVKILDFGIAQMANTGAGLTRTGLIMGTLRYISPEQVRGRADHRSDIYSVGAVFYELLALRPPFTGDDPMHLLEQLRTEEPPPVDQLDPSIPPALAGIIGRALRKDPDERYGDLAEMRTALEDVQTGLREEARHIGARLRQQQGRLLELRAQLADRVGALGEDETVPIIEERARLGAMQALERDLAARIATLERRIEQADQLAPAFQRASELLEGGQFADAVLELEAVVRDMPEHARAVEGLSRARAHVEAERRQQLAGRLLPEARAALAEGEYTLCLEILEQAAEIPLPPEVAQEVASLRGMAEGAATARESARRARQDAEGARARMAEARGRAQAAADTRYAAQLWSEAEAARAQAEAAFGQEAHASARSGFDAAAAAYRRFQDVAGEAERRALAAAEQARDQAADHRQRSLAEGAREYARERWEAAEARFAEAHAAFADRALDHAAGAFDEAAALYRRAEHTAWEAVQQERQRAEEARARMAAAREAALAEAPPESAPAVWDEAHARSTEAESALGRQAFVEAREAFDRAAATYHRFQEGAREAQRQAREAAARAREQAQPARASALAAAAPAYAQSVWDAAEARLSAGEAAVLAESPGPAAECFNEAAALYARALHEAGEARRQQQQEAEQARQTMAERRHAALSAEAASYAPADWHDAEAAAGAGDGAVTREAYQEAREGFARAAALYTRAEGRAREELRIIEKARADAERARASAAGARRTAADGQAPQYAPGEWQAAEQAEARADQASSRGDFPAARALFAEARRQYAAAAQAASIAVEAEDRRVDAMVSDARHLLSRGDVAASLRRLNEALRLRPGHAKAQEVRREAEERQRQTAAAEAAISAERRLEARRSQEACALARQAAAEAQAPGRAPDPWRLAEDAVARARVALERDDLAAASALFADAAGLYAGATRAAADARDAEDRMLRPGDPVADRLRREAESTRHGAEADETVWGGVSDVAQTATPGALHPTGAAADGQGGLGRSGHPVAATPTRGGPARIGMRRGPIIVLGALAAVIVLAVASWTLWLSPPEVWPPPAILTLQEQAVTTRNEAVRAGAEHAAQFALARSKEGAAEAALGRRDARAAERGYREAIAGYGLARGEVEQGRAAAVAAASAAAGARKKAETAAAPGRAAALWDKGEVAHREATAALERHLFDGARTLFGEAERLYGEAQQAAVAAVDARERDEAERARRIAAAARREAERADARHLAPRTFEPAQQKEQEAEASVERDPAAARAAFREATRGYKQATQEATVQSTARQRTGAEQARARMTEARRQAEQVAAGQRAPVLVDWALRKEREAAAAFERQDYTLAERLYGDALVDYETTAREARMAADRAASAQLSAEQARRRMTAYRERAQKTEADRLASDLFAIARAREAGADELLRRRSFPLAMEAYGEVGDRYLAAGRQAQDRRDADAAQAVMQSEKQRAIRNAPEYKDALAEERQGASAYERLQYREAAERFRTAQALYARATARTAAPPPAPAGPR
jgi:hypothetical protein